METASLVVGVPFGALALGWALFWVVAGFRAPMPASLSSFRGVMPRLYELKDRTNPDDPEAYFHKLEESLTTSRAKLEALLKLEGELGILDDEAWSDLRERAAPYLLARVPGRGWQALFDILNEAKGFAHLRRIGCTNVRFIPHAADKTPDLEGILNGGIVLCEVKTINISKEEAQRRQRVHQGEIVSTDISVRLSDGLLQKFTSTLNDAVGQLGSYDSQGQARRIVFAVIHFDDWVGNCQPEYFAQIDRHLQADPVVGAELVVCPASNLFGRRFTMRAASVVEL